MTVLSNGSIPSAPPSLVLFDLDDTLLEHRAAVDLGITVHRATLNTENFAPDDAAEVARWHELEEKHYHRYLSGERSTFLGNGALGRLSLSPHTASR